MNLFLQTIGGIRPVFLCLIHVHKNLRHSILKISNFQK
ncbi:hypothetical protein LEP1GSC127_2118 [Leptospira kirschneri str. 200801925]|nr:hypothetical protein LEP1GSC127_2118 [Leptospira kirschneri str. 200801925]